MSEDFRHKHTGRCYDSPADREFTDDDYNDALLDIESQLQAFPLSKTEDYKLPPTREPTTVRVDVERMVTEVREALNFDKEQEKTKQIGKDQIPNQTKPNQTKTKLIPN